MPTGVALRDPRAHLLAAAERVLARDGAAALTSRAVTEEAGVAKGVLHRHFASVDDLLMALTEERAARIRQQADQLGARAGTGTVVGNVASALAEAIDPVAVGLIALAIARDELRGRLRRAGVPGLPTLAETTAMLAGYLVLEQGLGRIAGNAEPAALARTLIGTGHLLFAGELGALPDPSAVEEVVEATMVGALVRSV